MQTNNKRIIKLGMDTRSRIGRAISLLVIGACGFVSGCRDYDVVWSAESRSPDGYWLATASEKRGGGFGNAYDATSVYLKQTKGSRSPVEVLEFSVGSSASQSGKLNLTMKWETPLHLDVTYNGHAATLYFQVVKCAGIDISVTDLSSATNTPQ
jgi:hypothetical protein